MHCQLFQPSGAHRAYAGIVPDVCPIASMLAELKIINMRGGPGLPHEHQLMLRAIETTHAGIALVPDTQVLELAVDLAAGGEHLPQVPPIHADLMDRAVDGVLGEALKHRLQEIREFGLAHLATAHGKIAMTNATEAADIAVDHDIVWRVREYEFRLGAVEQPLVGGLIAGIRT